MAIPPHIFARRQAQAEREQRQARARAEAEHDQRERQAKSDALTDQIRYHYNEAMRLAGRHSEILR